MDNFTGSVANTLIDSPSEICSVTSAKHIQAIASYLPLDLSSFFGFECRLGETAPSCDFLLCIHSALSGGQKLIQASHRFETHSWQLIRKFGEAWTNGILKERVDNIWLEFDCHTAQNDEEAAYIAGNPSFFFGMTQSEKPKEKMRLLLKDAISILSGQKYLQASWDLIEKCIQNIPDYAFVFQCGNMLSRASDLIRLCIRGLKSQDIAGYLEKIGLNCDIRILSDFVEKIAVFAHAIDIDLDILPQGICDKVGFEVRVRPDIGHPKEWYKFLDFLYELKLGLPEKLTGIKKWPVFHHMYENHINWPEHYFLTAIDSGFKYIHAFENFLYHIKINFIHSEPTEAKAYLATRYAWIDSSVINQMLRRKGQ
ncbi:MAG: hypothetical protein HQK79_15915 [Desulfobacterales bacterium]|nr:hypothetical protein [Desulfobacterales bacterium]MBF0396005.1 hypothetical protein [Desulfobacterales bacterium]